MSAINAKNGVVEVTPSASAQAVGEVKSWSIDTTMGTIDTSNMGSNFKEFLVGQASWSGSLDLWFDPDDAGQGAIETAMLAGDTMTIDIYPAGKVDGKPKLSGTMLITSWSPSGAVEDAVSLSVSFQGSSTLTSGTYTIV
ncbi:MAG: hypothetical protein K9L28_11300 [Synergistales bacterium]|nr:hypothetical protein [Synergistales bacterium]